MKNTVLTSAIALIAIFAITAAFSLPAKFTNAKWTKAPCVNGTNITGMATGLGEGGYYLHVTGKYDCVNKGSQTPSSENWSDLDIIIPVSPKAQGGNFKITATIPSLCSHANWSFYVADLDVTLYHDAALTEKTIDETDVYACQ